MAKYETKDVTIINYEKQQRKINRRRECRVRIIQTINPPAPLMREHKSRAPFFLVACGILRRLNI